MVWIPGGTFRMGSDEHYPEERPVHEVAVDGFWMDDHPVTVAEFRRFVKATGLRHGGRAAARPGRLPGRRSGAARARARWSSSATPRPVDLRRVPQLVALRARRTVAAPEGPGSAPSAATATRSPRSPTRTRPPTRRGRARSCRPRPNGSSPPGAGSTARSTPGATSSRPKGRMMANTWQGEFPWQNLRTTATRGRRRSRSFPPTATACSTWPATCGNGRPTSTLRRTRSWLSTPVADHRGRGSTRGSHHRTRPFPSGKPGEAFPRMVVKGGSHLCAPNYCLRYRPAARQAQSVETSTGHLGFRCIVRAPAS